MLSSNIHESSLGDFLENWLIQLPNADYPLPQHMVSRRISMLKDEQFRGLSGTEPVFTDDILDIMEQDINRTPCKRSHIPTPDDPSPERSEG